MWLSKACFECMSGRGFLECTKVGSPALEWLEEPVGWDGSPVGIKGETDMVLM